MWTFSSTTPRSSSMPSRSRRKASGISTWPSAPISTASSQMAKAALDIGFYISLSGIATFRNAYALREVARKVPADRLLVETDAPYLAPIPHRGKPNLPQYVREVAEFLAMVRGERFEDLAAQTTANFKRLFPLARVV